MDPRELVKAVLEGKTLAARQWVADAARARFDWRGVERPADLAGTSLSLFASLVELLAERAGQAAPAWTTSVPPSPEPLFLVKQAERMKNTRKDCEENAPPALKKRGFLAPRDYLTVT